jgi:polysaccharide pyruvyl transferase WcaK-like protein
LESIVLGVRHHRPDADLTVFDNGFGTRAGAVRVADRDLRVLLIGARHSRRLHRPDTLRTMRAAGALGGLGNPGVVAIRGATAVLDISGGDSFTDLYGRERFRQVMLPKQIVLGQDRPLVLMPQTFGPFRTGRARRQAERVVRQAHQAWARDSHAYERLVDLAGADFDPARHRSGVDVAFGLPAAPPAPDELTSPLDSWLRADRPVPVVGVNVSGLVYLGGESAARQYGLRVDYPELIHGLVDRLLARTDSRIVLVAHVIAPPGHPQSDLEAAHAVLDRLGEGGLRRVTVAPPPASASQAKALIGAFDWFCGTRMHSTIASLSSGVPTAGVAYSIKMAGIFETCDRADHVVDAVHTGTFEALEHLWWSWQQRETAAPSNVTLDDVRRRVVDQMGEILASINPVSTAPTTS